MNEKYIIDLSDDEREAAVAVINSTKEGVRRRTRARILIASAAGLSPREIEAALSTSTSTIYRTRKRFVNGGLEHSLAEKPRLGGMRKLSAKDEATLVAIACSEAPAGRNEWTLQLLADHLVALTDLESVSTETVRRRLKELNLKPWQKRMWCLSKVTPAFIARMEAILDLYAEAPDPTRPVVCFDETLKQLVAHLEQPIPAEPGKPQKVDHHYKRNGTRHLAVAFCAHRCWRKVWVLEHRGYVAFANLMRELVDVHFPEAEVVRVVLDNLNVHCEAALYHAFPPEEARRVLRRLELHFTPKKASWLNMVEIEIGVLARQCLDRRIASPTELAGEVAAWEAARNSAGATIKWMFDVEAARKKFKRHYPDVPERSETPTLQTA